MVPGLDTLITRDFENPSRSSLLSWTAFSNYVCTAAELEVVCFLLELTGNLLYYLILLRMCAIIRKEKQKRKEGNNAAGEISTGDQYGLGKVIVLCPTPSTRAVPQNITPGE